jgi:hypothetical protein
VVKYGNAGIAGFPNIGVPMVIDISRADKAAVLAALFNNARSQRMGLLHYKPRSMGLDEARGLLTGSLYFDYVEGRVMKVSLAQDDLDTWLYDRKNTGVSMTDEKAEVISVLLNVPLDKVISQGGGSYVVGKRYFHVAKPPFKHHKYVYYGTLGPWNLYAYVPNK